MQNYRKGVLKPKRSSGVCVSCFILKTALTTSNIIQVFKRALNIIISMSKEENGFILIKVVGPDNMEVHFRVKMSTRMEKVKKGYSRRLGIPLYALRCLFDGRRVNDEETPESLDMGDGDILEAYEERVGGVSSVTLKVIGVERGQQMHFEAKLEADMGRLKRSFSEWVDMPVSRLAFFFDAKKIEDDDTPKSLGMKLSLCENEKVILVEEEKIGLKRACRD